MSPLEPRTTFGLLTVAGIDVAVRASALREVVACPDTFAGLASAADGLLGALSLRELVIPVVELRSRLNGSAERGDDEVVAVIEHEGRVLGLLADNARGVAEVPESALLGIACKGDQLLSHSFQDPEDKRVVSVLDPGALVSLNGIPVLREVRRGHETATATGSESCDVAETLTVVRCGELLLALGVQHVHTTLPSLSPTPSPMDGTLCRGVVEFSDLEVAVADPLALLSRQDAPDYDGGLVLRSEEGFVVLAVSAAVDIVQVTASDILTVPEFAVERPDLIRGVLELDDGRQCMVLDGAGIASDPDIAALAALNVPVQASVTDNPKAAAEARHLVFTTAGTEITSPLEQVAEIVGARPGPNYEAPGVMLGVIVHRRTAVPVLCLASVLGLDRPSALQDGCLLLVAGESGTVAFAVESLRSIEAVTWRDATGTRNAFGCPLVGVGPDERLLPEADLSVLARRDLLVAA